jgi:uncharacterized protein YbjT (DUF2867 family)
MSPTPDQQPRAGAGILHHHHHHHHPRQLLAAEHHAGVGHHVVPSIVGIDRVKGNAHHAGKRAQERVALAGPVPATILRATQFFDYAAMVLRWTRHEQVATVAPLLIQPVAVTDVADVLVQVAAGAPQHGARELAGEVLLPGPAAQIAPTTFEIWLAAKAQPADTSRSSTGSTDSGPG